MRLRAEDVRDALSTRVPELLERHGVRGRGRRQLALRQCLACGKKNNPAAFKISLATGDWCHHAGTSPSCKGDVLALFGLLVGIDTRGPRFPELLQLAAAEVGLSPDIDPVELACIRAEHRVRREASERRAAEQRAAAEARVPDLWNQLEQRHLRGERYLADRGLAPAALRQRGDVVRFDVDGNPAVLLHDLYTGAANNIARRLIASGEIRFKTLDIAEVLGIDDDEVEGSLGIEGSLVGRVTALDRDGVDIAVIPEGVTDSLAAVLAYPSCEILGANGWAQMPAIAAAVAPRLVAARGWLLVAVDDDEQGITGASNAIALAMEAGLELRKSVRAIDVAPHHDLADAWAAGWRPRWPDEIDSTGGSS